MRGLGASSGSGTRSSSAGGEAAGALRSGARRGPAARGAGRSSRAGRDGASARLRVPGSAATSTRFAAARIVEGRNRRCSGTESTSLLAREVEVAGLVVLRLGDQHKVAERLRARLALVRIGKGSCAIGCGPGLRGSTCSTVRSSKGTVLCAAGEVIVEAESAPACTSARCGRAGRAGCSRCCAARRATG